MAYIQIVLHLRARCNGESILVTMELRYHVFPSHEPLSRILASVRAVPDLVPFRWFIQGLGRAIMQRFCRTTVPHHHVSSSLPNRSSSMLASGAASPQSGAGSSC